MQTHFFIFANLRPLKTVFIKFLLDSKQYLLINIHHVAFEVDDIEELATEGELSDEMRGAIRAVAGEFMARLRYE